MSYGNCARKRCGATPATRTLLNEVRSPESLWLVVENSDALFNRTISAGAKVQMPMAYQFWGDRAGAVADPAGYTWWIATRKEDLTQAEMQQRAAEFFKQMSQPTSQ